MALLVSLCADLDTKTTLLGGQKGVKVLAVLSRMAKSLYLSIGTKSITHSVY